MPDLEISREDAALVLKDFQNALDDLNELLKNKARKLIEPPDAFGSGVDGKKSLDRAKQNGENLLKYVKDTIQAVTEHRDAAKARFDALFGTDFDSKVDISKIQPQIQVPSF